MKKILIQLALKTHFSFPKPKNPGGFGYLHPRSSLKKLTTHHHKLAVTSISIQLVETYFLRLLDILFVEVTRVCSYVQRGPSGADSCLEYKIELRRGQQKGRGGRRRSPTFSIKSYNTCCSNTKVHSKHCMTTTLSLLSVKMSDG